MKLHDPSETRIMGVINVTPDSFSDGGEYLSSERAVVCAHRLESEGAHILDIGGESSRPGAESVPAAEELDRVIPVIRQLAGKVSIPISIDTYKSEVAEAALDAGATIINDISALRFDARMSKIAAKSGCKLILMHMLG